MVIQGSRPVPSIDRRRRQYRLYRRVLEAILENLTLTPESGKGEGRSAKEDEENPPQSTVDGRRVHRDYAWTLASQFVQKEINESQLKPLDSTERITSDRWVVKEWKIRKTRRLNKKSTYYSIHLCTVSRVCTSYRCFAEYGSSIHRETLQGNFMIQSPKLASFASDITCCHPRGHPWNRSR